MIDPTESDPLESLVKLVPEGRHTFRIEGENGFTCDRTEEFVDRILALEAAPDQLIRLGATSRKLAEGGYIREAVVPRWRSLYTNIEHYRRFA